MSVYKELLEHFCHNQKHIISTSSRAKEIIKKPFIDRNFVCSSDTVGLILIPRTRVEEEKYTDHRFFTSKPWSGMINVHAELIVSELDLLLEKLKTPTKRRFRKNVKVLVHKAHFSPAVIDDYILFTAKQLKVETITFVHYSAPYKAFAFKIKDCIVLVMPLRGDYTDCQTLKICQNVQIQNIPFSVYDDAK